MKKILAEILKDLVHWILLVLIFGSLVGLLYITGFLDMMWNWLRSGLCGYE